MPSHYQLLPATDYASQLIKSINRANDRIAMIALTIAEDDGTREIIDALCQASQRGVNVNIGFDIYFTYREIEKTTSRLSRLPHRLRLMRSTKRRLERAGVKVRWLGQSTFPFILRRTHTKWSVIDDTVYSFGGVNLYKLGITSSVDYMFRVTDSDLADAIYNEHRRIIHSDKAGHGYRSHLFGAVDRMILIDGGKIFDSIIYRHALVYAREATAIDFVSQYCPTGRLGRLLTKHPHARLHFNHWRNVADPINRIMIRFNMFRMGATTDYDGSTYLHAKFIIFTMPTGQKIAITGSHNFISGGGMLGTREVALETTDPEIIGQLEDFLDNHIRS